MDNQKVLIWIKKLQVLFLLCLLLFPLTLNASFIEATMGTAVVNDATATYFNPAALMLLKNPQIITLDSIAALNTQFTGQATQSRSGFTQSGSSSTQTNYNLPALYLGMPIKDRITFGLAVISNFFDTALDEGSVLRYAQSNNNIESIDLVPALGLKLNDFVSLGAGINLSYAKFLLMPTSGFPSLNVSDSQSRNECDGTGMGGNFGVLLKPTHSTLVGFDYRSAITYRLSGTSVFGSNPPVISNDYGFNFWTPARFVLSANQSVTSALGIIGTIQRIEWSIFKDINIHGIAAEIGSRPIILSGNDPYHFHDTWLLTLGSYYHITPKWVIRVASSYNQSPANNNFQISNGNSTIVGASTGYEIYKNIMIDGSYAHAFFQGANIHIANGRNVINGIQNAFLNAFTLKLTLKF